ncbi:hypothetical protein [Liquorilactobacillus vini]|uniref:hypothetical protein n=1 Tax=Liquorilactobacillus vini TaxID=238015 RepID=UPI00029B4C47|nr:hypothetical protein [Liquorilactobacillus vini]
MKIVFDLWRYSDWGYTVETRENGKLHKFERYDVHDKLLASFTPKDLQQMDTCIQKLNAGEDLLQWKGLDSLPATSN